MINDSILSYLIYAQYTRRRVYCATYIADNVVRLILVSVVSYLGGQLTHK